MADSAARKSGATEYMVYASEVHRSTVMAMNASCPLAAFVVRVLHTTDDGIVVKDIVTGRELTFPAGELLPANYAERMAGMAAELMDAMPERKFRSRPEPFAVGRWSVDDICKYTDISPWTVRNVISKAGIEVVYRRPRGAFKPYVTIRYTDANRVVDACMPPKGWCTRKQATAMTGLDKAKLDKAGVRTMPPSDMPGAPATPYYNIDDLRDVRRNCAMYGRVTAPQGKSNRKGTVTLDVEVPKGSTATEHIELIRKAVDGRRKTKIKIKYK